MTSCVGQAPTLKRFVGLGWVDIRCIQELKGP